MLSFLKMNYFIFSCLLALNFVASVPNKNSKYKIWEIQESRIGVVTSDIHPETYVTYLKPYPRTQHMYVYYRIGNRSSLEMRKKAAHFATELMYTINSTTPAAIPLKRIEEGYEGCYDTFKQFFKLEANCPKWRKLYKVKGLPKVLITEVPAIPNNLNKNDCFVLDTGVSVHASCGPYANDSEIEKTIALSHFIQIFTYKVDCTRLKKNLINLTEFNELLGGTSDYSIAINDAIKDSEFEIYRYNWLKITKYIGSTKEAVETWPLFLQNIISETRMNSLLLQSTYIICDEVNGNIFVYLTKYSTLADIQLVLESLEEQVSTGYPGYRATIVQSNEILPIDFKILFSDEVEKIKM